MKLLRMFPLLAVFFMLLVAIQANATPGSSTPHKSRPRGHGPARITEYRIPTSEADAFFIAAGPDGNLWFTEDHSKKIGKITPNGSITEYAIPNSPNENDAEPEGIAAGPDGNLWFAEYSSDANNIGKITPGGTITEYRIPTGGYSAPYGIAKGPEKFKRWSIKQRLTLP